MNAASRDLPAPRARRVARYAVAAAVLLVVQIALLVALYRLPLPEPVVGGPVPSAAR